MIGGIEATIGEIEIVGIPVDRVTVLERNAAGDISRCSCLTADIPSAVAGYAIGCILIATDGDSATTVLKVNSADSSSCTFAALGVVAPPIGCAYPFNADATEVVGVGFAARLTMSDAEQTGTMTVEALVEKTYGALPTGFPPGGATLDFTADTGIKVIEVAFTVPAAEVDVVLATAYNGVFTLNNTVTIQVGARNTGLFSIDVNAGGPIFVDDAAASVPAVFGIVLDTSTGVATVIAGGAQLGIAGTFTPAAITAYLEATTYATANVLDIGKSLSMSVRTNAANFTGDYSAYPGATDTCGNVI